MAIGFELSKLRARLKRVERSRWVIGSIAFVITSFFVFIFIIEAHSGYLLPKEYVVYFESWDDGRTREEAIAVQKEEMRIKAEAEAVAQALADGVERAEIEPADMPEPDVTASTASPAGSAQ